MGSWVVVPCLLTLRAEFSEVSPKRDKGADGTVADNLHGSASDHQPDEDSAILRDHDADDKNEVHALDIDSTGPWPGGQSWFVRTIVELVAREKTDYESPTTIGRLQYVIWDGRIASRSWGWTWRYYVGADQHTGHVHFSARYLTAAESATRGWGVYVPPVPKPAQELEDMTEDQIEAVVLRALGKWSDVDPDSTATPPGTGRIAGWIRNANKRERERFDGVNAKLDTLLAEIASVDESVVQALFDGSDEQLIPVLRTGLGDERLKAIAAKILAGA